MKEMNKRLWALLTALALLLPGCGGGGGKRKAGNHHDSAAVQRKIRKDKIKSSWGVCS